MCYEGGGGRRIVGLTRNIFLGIKIGDGTLTGFSHKNCASSLKIIRKYIIKKLNSRQPYS